jgi:sucrose-phosphate synthase
MHQSSEANGLKVALISLHGLIRVHEPELGRDADTGGQVRYVLELAGELGQHKDVSHVELITRQIIDPRVDPRYGQLEETIGPNAKLVRIPFGPKRYLKKESLWPYIDFFIDQMLVHFRRHGLPDVIHGHYADAGFAGAQLSRLLHIPFVFTGHSLGRVKRQRMLLGSDNLAALEKRYRFQTRIEAEEMALETASMVVTSTNQEVQQQYGIYDHYQPDRMEVIPPGVDLKAFCPAPLEWPPPPIATEIDWFLKNPEKPVILAMCRPDERKNLETLVQVFGESEPLQEKANLVLVMGSRDDLRELPKAQQSVLNNVLYLIDRFDLYGSVAYPKSHLPNDAADLYRLAAKQRGVFVNPALTEPFGLTLLEAAASGLPVVATSDGGPMDIIANCQNGLLIDPLDREAIEKALMRVLSESSHWDEWSANGIRGANEFYTWKMHADRYLRDVIDIVNHAERPAAMDRTKSRQLPEFDRLIITDLDNTLTGDDRSLAEFIEIVKSEDHIGLGIATGRTLESALSLMEELHLPRPDVLATDCGTGLHYGQNLTPDLTWQRQIGEAWQPEEVRRVLDDLPGVFPQEEEHQSEYKVCYEIDAAVAPNQTAIRKLLREAGLRVKVVISLGMYMDVIPVRGGSGLCLRHLLFKWGFNPEQVLVAGDSGNDAGMLLGKTLGVVVGNHGNELEYLRKRPRIYFARASHAAGIVEGIHYYQFLNDIVIPNDWTE